MNPLLMARGVGKSYGNRCVLREATFDARRGEVLGLVGPNGAGKTTLLRLAVGLLAPGSGVVTLDGESLPGALRRVNVAYFAGGSTLPPSVAARRWSRLFGAENPAAETRPIRLLSRGTRQMLGLRSVFAEGAQGSDLVVLDEPWEGLDPDATRWLTESMRARRDAGAAILVSSHRLHELADVCDRCAFLVDGRVTLVDVRGGLGGTVTAAALLEAFDALRQIP
jgi:ABC-2 type transport system ATP-binding protein